MSTRSMAAGLLTILGWLAMPAVSLEACQFTQSDGFEVSESHQKVELMAGSSRRLTFEFNIPELQIENPEVVRATCVSPNEINLTGVKPGVTTLTVSDADKKLHSIIVNVAIDTRKLELTLRQYFTDSSVQVTPLQTGVLLTGYVARAEDINNVLAVTRDFFPSSVVNQLRVDGSQVVATEVKVYEVSRTKLRRLGIDWGGFGQNGRIATGFSDLIQNVNDLSSATGNFTASVFDNSSGVVAVLNALEQRNVARLMTQPTLVSQNGRPAELLSGGEIPIQINVGLGTNAIQFRAFGTRLDVVPLVHGQGDLTLEVRAEVSEVAPELAGDTGVPGFRVRRVNTSAPMRSGQTLVLAGVYSEASSGESKGAPGLSNKPGIGAFFRNVSNQTNETELVFLLTPRTVAPIDASQLPATMPGRSTTDPSNHELFIKGHIEVPRCDQQCPENNPYLHSPSAPVAPIDQPLPTDTAPGAFPATGIPLSGTAPVLPLQTNPQPPQQPQTVQRFQPAPPPSVRDTPANAPFAPVPTQPASFGDDKEYFSSPKETKIDNNSRFGFPQTSNGSNPGYRSADSGSSRSGFPR